jgi:hypothetical protein
MEGGADSTVDAPPDSPPPVDSQSPETGGDSGTDAPPDTGVPDVEAGSPIPAFLNQVTSTLCTKLQTCCAGPLEGGTFNMSLCTTSLTATGYEGMNVGAAYALEAGVLTYDPARAAACVNDINAIDCVSNVITSAQQLAILSDCVAAVSGSLAGDAGCFYSIECAPGTFCDTPSDAGGPGTCAPLRGDGGACGNFGTLANTYDYGLGEEACSFRRTGNTGLFCYERDLITGADIDGGPAAWACRPAGAAGGCNVDQECASGLCDPGPPGFGYTAPDGAVSFGSVYQCANSTPFTYLNTCLPFAQ